MGHSRAAKQSGNQDFGKKSKQWDNQTSRLSRTMYSKPIEVQYNGFRMSGTAQPVAMANTAGLQSVKCCSTSVIIRSFWSTDSSIVI